MKIALVEDNAAISEYLRIALEMKGHHIQVFTQGALLLDTLFPASGIAAPLPFDLITVDLFLPGELPGRQVITRIREAIPAHRLPIIVISGLPRQDLEDVQRQFPDMPVLSKPFQLRTLLRLIEQVQTAAEDQEQPGEKPLSCSSNG